MLEKQYFYMSVPHNYRFWTLCNIWVIVKAVSKPEFSQSLLIIQYYKILLKKTEVIEDSSLLQ